MAVRKDEKTKKWYFYGKYKDPITNKYKDYKRRGFRTKQEAKFAESQFVKELNEQADGKVKFKTIYDEYFEHQKMQIKESSFYTTKQKAEKHIAPYFSDMYCNQINAKEIRQWKDNMNNKNLSIKYKSYIFILLKTIIDYGAKYYNVDNRSIALEGNFKESNISKKEMLFWTLDEFNEFDSVIDDLEYKVFYNFLYWTGCRRGEALALNWNDFSTDFKNVKITKTCYQKIKGKPYIITSPKTKGSVRTISLPERLIVLLKELYDYDKNIAGFSNSCFVFGVERPLHDTTIEARKNRYCKKAQIKQIRIHDFRHSHASYLINNMPNDKNIILAISKRLGHSDPTTTLRIYSHMMPEAEDKILEMLNNNSF